MPGARTAEKALYGGQAVKRGARVAARAIFAGDEGAPARGDGGCCGQARAPRASGILRARRPWSGWIVDSSSEPHHGRDFVTAITMPRAERTAALTRAPGCTFVNGKACRPRNLFRLTGTLLARGTLLDARVGTLLDRGCAILAACPDGGTGRHRGLKGGSPAW